MIAGLIVAAYTTYMVFNHYAKLARIVRTLDDGWYIRRIDKPTTTLRFNGATNHYDHYYRIVDVSGIDVPYGKFQQLDKLAGVLNVDINELPLID